MTNFQLKIRSYAPYQFAGFRIGQRILFELDPPIGGESESHSERKTKAENQKIRKCVTPLKILNFLSSFLLLVGLGLTSFAGDVYAAATLSVTPNSQSVTVGTAFPVEIRLNSGGEAVNTVTANLTFSKDKIRLQSVSTTASFLTIWFELPDTESEVVAANNNGEIRITGSLPTPGQSGSNLLVAKLTFIPIATGTANLNFASTSAVYRNSDNSNIIGTSNVGGTYTITEISPTPTPTPTPTTIIPTPSLTVPAGTGNGKLPDVGIETPTFFLFVLSLLLIGSGFWLLRTS